MMPDVIKYDEGIFSLDFDCKDFDSVNTFLMNDKYRIYGGLYDSRNYLTHITYNELGVNHLDIICEIFYFYYSKEENNLFIKLKLSECLDKLLSREIINSLNSNNGKYKFNLRYKFGLGKKDKDNNRRQKKMFPITVDIVKT